MKSDGQTKQDALRGSRILVVSSNEQERTLLSRLSASTGFDCEFASEMSSAIDELVSPRRRNQPFHVVLLDDNLLQSYGPDAYIERMQCEGPLRNASHVLLCTDASTINLDRLKQAGFAAYFTRPLHPEPLMDAVATIRAIQKERASAAKRVLLVDDSKVNLKVTTKLLEKVGMQVEAAHNGREAVERLTTDSFDLVLMDCQMPVMDGFEATKEIRGLSPESQRIPIIALTAGESDAEVQKCLQAGMNSVIAKPINKRKIENILKTLWEK